MDTTTAASPSLLRLRFAVFRDRIRRLRNLPHYSRWAALLAITSWLYGQLLGRTTMFDVLEGYPGLMLFTCGLFAVISMVAVGLAVLGAWNPRRSSVVLSCAAVVLACVAGV